MAQPEPGEVAVVQSEPGEIAMLVAAPMVVEHFGAVLGVLS